MPSQTLPTKLVMPSVFAAYVLRILDEEGIAAGAALDGTGLTVDDLADRGRRIRYDQYLSVVENALQLTREPGLGIRLGQYETLPRQGVYGYAILSSSDLRHALQVACRYSAVNGGLLALALRVENETAVLSATEAVPLGDLHSFAVENALAVFATTVSAASGAGFEFEEVRLDYPPPPHRALLEEFFACPVRFACESVEIRFPARLLDLPLDLSDPEAAEACQRHCDILLERLGARGGIVDRVRKHLLLTPGDFPDVETTARRLGMSSRTLNRQLREHGTSYLQILNEVRKELAIQYLRQSDLSTDEIAERLGYTETTNFRRAFKRWTGKSTSAYRLG